MPKSNYENHQIEARQRGRQLAMLGYVGTAGLATWFWLNSPWQNPFLLILTICIFCLGIVPMLQWLERGDEAYPLPEVLQLTLVPFYAVPLFSEHEAIMVYPESTLVTATLLVVLFQLSCFLGALAAGHTFERPSRVGWLEQAIVSENSLKFTTYTLMTTTLWLLVSTYTQWVPANLGGTLRAIFFGIGTLSTFILARMWGSDQLTPQQKVLFIINVVLQIILPSLGLLLVTGLITFLLAFVGYFSTARRFPWLVCLIALITFSVLHNGKYRMRQIYWGEDTQPVSLIQTPAYLSEWVGYGLQKKDDSDQERHSATHTSIFQRASLIQIVCHSVETVPSNTPFFGGSTYWLIPPQIVPRLLWPNKPSPNDSVKQLSIGLGLLNEQDAETTSIGFGLIAESYVNFGFYGTTVLGLLLGWVLRRVALRTADCGILSFGGIFRTLCLAWCLNTETTLAVWLSSFYQACIAILVPLLCIRSFLKRR